MRLRIIIDSFIKYCFIWQRKITIRIVKQLDYLFKLFRLTCEITSPDIEVRIKKNFKIKFKIEFGNNKSIQFSLKTSENILAFVDFETFSNNL